MCDTTSREVAEWMEPVLTGDIPVKRKAATAGSSANKIAMFGGLVMDAEDNLVATDDLVIFEVTGPNSLQAALNPAMGGQSKPAARSYASMLELSHGKLFVYGGMGADNKPLNDAWVLDIANMAWECVYYGSNELVLPTGNVATLLKGRFVMLNAGAGSPRMDLASSLDIFELRDALAFTPKMKVMTENLLKGLEEWVDTQGHGMELAK